ncbi:MAG: MAPEG family protein [Pseudomonadota bacterium]
MTIAYWCVLTCAIMPYLLIVFAKAACPNLDNRKPRESLDTLTGWPQRAAWAQANAFESFPMFAAAVIIASLIEKIDSTLIDTLAVSYVLSRIVYSICYVFDRHILRSTAWCIGVAIWFSLFVMSA